MTAPIHGSSGLRQVDIQPDRRIASQVEPNGHRTTASTVGFTASSSAGSLQFSFNPIINTKQAAQRITSIITKDEAIWSFISLGGFSQKDGHPSTWIGWVNAPSDSLQDLEQIRQIIPRNRQILLIGTGGSGLGAEVQMSGKDNAFVLDGLDPAEINSTLAKLNPKEVIVFVASKSGTTGEIALLDSQVRKWMSEEGGNPKEQFIGITDDPHRPGSFFNNGEQRFRTILIGNPSIGGRNSCHSIFGVAPSIACGAETRRFLESAVNTQKKYQAVSTENSEVTEKLLGVQIHHALKQALEGGRNKITLQVGKGLEKIDFWTAQLINESLAKGKNAPVTIVDEPLADNSTSYGKDRIVLQFETGPQEVVEVLPTYENQGVIYNVPTIKATISEDDIGALLYHMEWVVALLGLDLKVHPFNQPAVEEYKVDLKRNLVALANDNSEESIAEKALQAGAKSVLSEDIKALSSKANGNLQTSNLQELIRAFVCNLREDQYIGILSATNRSKDYDDAVRDVRKLLVDSGRSTISGYIPRRCHSDNQLSVSDGFDQVAEIIFTFDTPKDISVDNQVLTNITQVSNPTNNITFGQVNRTIAHSLFQALNRKGKNALMIHLPSEFRNEPEKLVHVFNAALS